MNHKLFLPYLHRVVYRLFMAGLIATLTSSTLSVQSVQARATSISDLVVRVISLPTSVKACQTFKATFSVTNRGPDPASQLYMIVMLPDPLGLVRLRGAPQSLAVGKTVTFSADIKVVAFVPGESRKAWVGINAMSDPYPDTSFDPNQENNSKYKKIRLASQPKSGCP